MAKKCLECDAGLVNVAKYNNPASTVLNCQHTQLGSSLSIVRGKDFEQSKTGKNLEFGFQKLYRNDHQVP